MAQTEIPLESGGSYYDETPTNISQQAQDLSKATGSAYEQIANEQENPTTPYTPASMDSSGMASDLSTNTNFNQGSSYLTKATDTVAGQLETLLASDSPYITQARNQAKEQAQSRGLLNTTMAAEGGQRAAIQSALPIAQQDAQTYAAFQQAQQAAEYGQETIKSEAIASGYITEQKAAIDRKHQELQNSFNAQMQAAGDQSKIWLQDFQNTFNKDFEEMKALNQQTLLGLEISSQARQSVAEQTGALIQNYQVSVENMLLDPDLMAAGPEAVNNALRELQMLTKNSIKLIAQSNNVDIDDTIDMYLNAEFEYASPTTTTT